MHAGRQAAFWNKAFWRKANHVLRAQCPSYFGSPAWGNQECPSYFGSPAWGNQECPSCFGYHIRPIEGQGKKGKGRERKGLAGLAGLWGAQPPRNGVQCLRFEGVRREAMNAEISSPSFHPHPILGCSCMHVFFFWRHECIAAMDRSISKSSQHPKHPQHPKSPKPPKRPKHCKRPKIQTSPEKSAGVRGETVCSISIWGSCSLPSRSFFLQIRIQRDIPA